MDVLLEAASQAFSREGMSATTNRIAERAGVSVGTLYQYFPNKEMLLRALAERHVVAAGIHLERVFGSLRREQPPFDETVRAMLQALVDLHSDRPGLHRIMHRLAPRIPNDIEALQALEASIADEITFHLKRCDRGGDDVELTAHTILATVDAQLHRVMTHHGFNVDDLVRTVTTLAGTPR